MKEMGAMAGLSALRVLYLRNVDGSFRSYRRLVRDALSYRLVTVVGGFGMGKSAVAAAAAQYLLDRGAMTTEHVGYQMMERLCLGAIGREAGASGDGERAAELLRRVGTEDRLAHISTSAR